LFFLRPPPHTLHITHTDHPSFHQNSRSEADRCRAQLEGKASEVCCLEQAVAAKDSLLSASSVKCDALAAAASNSAREASERSASLIKEQGATMEVMSAEIARLHDDCAVKDSAASAARSASSSAANQHQCAMLEVRSELAAKADGLAGEVARLAGELERASAAGNAARAAVEELQRGGGKHVYADRGFRLPNLAKRLLISLAAHSHARTEQLLAEGLLELRIGIGKEKKGIKFFLHSFLAKMRIDLVNSSLELVVQAPHCRR
jgi:hypothetical protein